MGVVGGWWGVGGVDAAVAEVAEVAEVTNKIGMINPAQKQEVRTWRNDQPQVLPVHRQTYLIVDEHSVRGRFIARSHCFLVIPHLQGNAKQGKARQGMHTRQMLLVIFNRKLLSKTMR